MPAASTAIPHGWLGTNPAKLVDAANAGAAPVSIKTRVIRIERTANFDGNTQEGCGWSITPSRPAARRAGLAPEGRPLTRGARPIAQGRQDSNLGSPGFGGDSALGLCKGLWRPMRDASARRRHQPRVSRIPKHAVALALLHPFAKTMTSTNMPHRSVGVQLDHRPHRDKRHGVIHCHDPDAPNFRSQTETQSPNPGVPRRESETTGATTAGPDCATRRCPQPRRPQRRPAAGSASGS